MVEWERMGRSKVLSTEVDLTNGFSHISSNYVTDNEEQTYMLNFVENVH